MTKLKPFIGKARQSAQSCLNQNLVIGDFLEICFEATLRSKTNVLSIYKWLFKSKVDHKKHFRKLF